MNKIASWLEQWERIQINGHHSLIHFVTLAVVLNQSTTNLAAVQTVLTKNTL